MAMHGVCSGKIIGEGGDIVTSCIVWYSDSSIHESGMERINHVNDIGAG